MNSGVQSINNVYAIVDKVENVCVKQYIFNLIDNGVYVVYALYSRIGIFGTAFDQNGPLYSSININWPLYVAMSESNKSLGIAETLIYILSYFLEF